MCACAHGEALEVGQRDPAGRHRGASIRSISRSMRVGSGSGSDHARSSASEAGGTTLECPRQVVERPPPVLAAPSQRGAGERQRPLEWCPVVDVLRNEAPERGPGERPLRGLRAGPRPRAGAPCSTAGRTRYVGGRSVVSRANDRDGSATCFAVVRGTITRRRPPRSRRAAPGPGRRRDRGIAARRRFPGGRGSRTARSRAGRRRSRSR